MRIYIPYKHTQVEELKFCLRSIEKYITGYEDVFLITDKTPDWYRGKIIYHSDVSSRKQLNIISKLFQVKDEKFIMFNDDHFLLKPLHINEIKNWYHGTLKEALNNATGNYYTAIKNTIGHFGDIRYFDIHTPAVFTKDGIHRVFRLEWGDNEYIIKSAFFNSAEGEEITDCKINHPMSKMAIEDRIKGRTFFSTGPNGMRMQMMNLLNELFSEKSKWEK